MAEKLQTLKCKSVVSDDSCSEDDNVNGDDHLLTLEKLNIGPKKKLLVLSPGGLLVYRVHVLDKATVLGYKPDVTFRNFLVFKRPFCAEFLNFCFQRFEVGIWSSAMKHNIEVVLSSIMVGVKGKFSFVWDQDDCTNSGFQSLENKEKRMFLKELKKLWENNGKNLPWRGGRYSSSNTLLIDDDPYNALLNPPNTAIFPHRYKVDLGEDTFLGPKGEMQEFLDGLVDAKDVPSYVKEHPLGQPAITPTHPDWDYYFKIIEKNRNGGAA